MRTLDVDLGSRSYPIHIGSGLLAQGELLQTHLSASRALVVTNTTVAPLWLPTLQRALPDCELVAVELPDGESFKTLETLTRVYDRLLEQRFDRGATLIALGGGVVGDMTGFAAATYQRGVNFIQVPTTLLAQVDSSVGGKTGVNHPLGKNMIGAFHQPRCVLIDTDTLGTLPKRELAAGLAEVIKYGLIADPGFLAWCREHIDALLAREPATLSEAIFRSCAAKAAVVQADEREGGIRAILNLGHTFGHAIETEQGYGSWLHGEAVAAGMVMAADLSARLGWIDTAEVEALRSLLQHCELPIAPPPDMTAERFLELMAVDKKVLDGRLRLVLLRQTGEAVVTSEVPRELLLETLHGF